MPIMTHVWLVVNVQGSTYTLLGCEYDQSTSGELRILSGLVRLSSQKGNRDAELPYPQINLRGTVSIDTTKDGSSELNLWWCMTPLLLLVLETSIPDSSRQPLDRERDLQRRRLAIRRQLPWSTCMAYPPYPPTTTALLFQMTWDNKVPSLSINKLSVGIVELGIVTYTGGNLVTKEYGYFLFGGVALMPQLCLWLDEFLRRCHNCSSFN